MQVKSTCVGNPSSKLKRDLTGYSKCGLFYYYFFEKSINDYCCNKPKDHLKTNFLRKQLNFFIRINDLYKKRRFLILLNFEKFSNFPIIFKVHHILGIPRRFKWITKIIIK